MILWIPIVAALSTACGDENGKACTAIAVAGLNIAVIDSATGLRICDATVVATAGDYEETLEALGPGGSSCGYAGAWERAGTYTVEVSKTGYTSTSQSDITVVEGECHVTGEQRELELVPN